MKKTITTALSRVNEFAYAQKKMILALVLIGVLKTNGYAQLDICTTPVTLPPITSGLSSVLLGASVTGQTIELSGTLTIDAPLTINACNIRMTNSAAKIQMLAGAAGMPLTIANHTHIYAGGCGGNNSWDGIYNPNPNVYLNISDNSLIEDATSAVNSTNGGAFKITDAIFNRNFTAINITTYNSPGNYIIRGTLITCREASTDANPLSANYPTEVAMVNDITSGIGTYPMTTLRVNSTWVSRFGILADHNSMVNIGDGGIGGYLNTFDNLSIGIRLTYTNAVIYNNQFVNLQKNTALFKNGTGITAAGASGYVYSITIGGAGLHESNKFTDNLNSIDIRTYTSINVLYNKIDENTTIPVQTNSTGAGWKGIYIDPNNGSSVHVLNNEIKNNISGITIHRQVTGWDALEIIVGENVIVGGGISTQYCRTAIDLQDIGSPFAPSMLADKYKIRNNEINQVYNGIVATGVTSGLVIYDDPMYLPQPHIEIIHYPGTIGTNIFCGIRIENCPNARVYNNYVSSPDALVTNNANNVYRGIYVVTSKYSEQTCNIINNYSEAMSYNGNSNGSFIRNNSMSTGRNGFALRNGAVIGVQGTPTDPCGLTWDTYSPPFINETYVDAITLNPFPNSVLYVQDPSPIGWITIPTLNLGMGISNAYVLGAASGLQSSAGAGFVCSNVVVQMIAQGGGDAATAQLKALVNDTLQYATYEEEERYSSKILAFNVLDTTNGITTDTTGVLQNFYDSTKVASIGQFKEVEKAIVNKDYATADAINTSTPVNNTIEANQKLVNYYNLLKQNNPDYIYNASDSASIYSVAVQCPSEGGLIIWSARLMYFDIVGERIGFEDACSAMGKSLVHKPTVSTQESSRFALYPNPSNGKIVLDYIINTNENVEFTIYDLSGRSVKTQTLNAENTTTTINLPELSAGAYYYIIRMGQKVVKSDKLIIIN